MARDTAGRPPRYIVTDQGSQFQGDYRRWCARHGVRPRFGAVGKKGSIAVIERFFRSLKGECCRRILVPCTLEAMVAELDLYLRWYNECRPHRALGGLTPAGGSQAQAEPRRGPVSSRGLVTPSAARRPPAPPAPRHRHAAPAGSSRW
jgi:transposase InsO family protein